MKKIIISSIILSIGLAQSGQTEAMFRGSRFKFNNDSFKRGFYKVCNFAHVGISVGIPLLSGINALKTQGQQVNGASSCSDPVKEFVHNELKKIGIQNPEPINVKFLPLDAGFGATDGKTIYLGLGDLTSYRSDLEELLDRQKKKERLKKDPLNRKKKHPKKTIKNDDALSEYDKSLADAFENFYGISDTRKHLTENEINKKLNNIRFTIQHEGNHIKNNDYTNSALANIGTPCAIHVSFEILKKMAAQGKVPSSAIPSIAQSLKLIPFAGLKLGLTTALTIIQARNQEQRADDQAQDDTTILKAGSEGYTKYHEMAFTEFKKTHRAENYSTDELKQKFELYSLRVDPSHPTPLQRAEKLEQRIAALDAKKSEVKEK